MPPVPFDLGFVHVVVVVRLAVFPVEYDDVEGVHVLEFGVLPRDLFMGRGELGIANLASPEG